MTWEERWSDIRAWFQAHQPNHWRAFRSGAKESEVAAAEEQLGVRFPNDYRNFLLLHDGMKDGAPFVEWASLLPVSEIPDAHQLLQELLDEEDEYDGDADKGVRKTYLSPRWIPIGRSPRGRDYLCLDFDPAKGGKVGQIVLFVVDDSDRERIAGSFKGLLKRYLKDLKKGEIEFWDE